MHIGIFLPNWIGDVAMATPTLRALRRRFGPPARLVGILRPYVADVLAGTDWIDEYLFYDPRGKEASLGSRNLVRQLRARRLDMAILLTHSLRTGILAWAGGARERIGFAKNGRGLLLTRKLRQPRQGWRYARTSALDDYLKLAYAVGCSMEAPRLELGTLAEDEAAADRVWEKFDLRSAPGVVVINSGGAFGAAKVWPAEHCATLARRIAQERRLAVLVNCGPAERDAAREIVRQAADRRVVSLADESLSLGLSKACIRRSQLLVTTDSGPRFFGAAFGLPVVVLFGPTDPRWSEIHYPRERALAHALPCGPCLQRTCPLHHHRCMRDLDPDEVYQAAMEQLDAQREAA